MILLKLALLQIAPGDSIEENLQKGLAVCREAKAKGADIALFPEMWSNGYRRVLHGVQHHHRLR